MTNSVTIPEALMPYPHTFSFIINGSILVTCALPLYSFVWALWRSPACQFSVCLFKVSALIFITHNEFKLFMKKTF
jgi:hypothetical protein